MIQQINEGSVNSETHQGITTIEFFHPQGNSLPGKILEILAKEIHFAGTHSETKVIVLRSSGDKAFCGGASFQELSEITSEHEATNFFTGFAHVINAMRKCPKFIIARIQGKCVGGGVGLAAAADYAIAAEGADIRLSELSFGIGPFVIGPVVEKKIGFAAFSALAIDSCMWRNSQWAKQKGLFAEVHESIENMNESVARLANQLMHTSPAATMELKKILWKDTEHWEHILPERAAISGKLLLTEFSKDAVSRMK